MKTYLFALLVLAFLLVFHTLGIFQNYYLYFWPYDIIAHILGGLGIGLFVAGIAQTFFPTFFSTQRTLKIVALVFAVGFAWEIFEVIYNLAGYPFGTKGYYLDTLKDLVDDVIGGLFAVYITRPKSTEETV